jgi:hypothetical protein
METSGTVLVSALALFLTWSIALASSVVWLSSKFLALERAIGAHITFEDYEKAHAILVIRITQLERWALRLNGSVRVPFSNVSDRDYRVDE